MRGQSGGRRHHERTDETEKIPAYLTTEGRERTRLSSKIPAGCGSKIHADVDKGGGGGRVSKHGISGTARDIGGSTEVKSVEGTDHHGDRISKVQREQQRRWKDVLLAQRIETGSERVWLVAKRRSIRQV